MEKINLKARTWIMIAGVVIIMSIIMNSCVESKKVAAKSGAQLWSENCQRCHNTPSPVSFSHEQWITIGMHMQTRAQITDKERDKIVAFLSQ
jgi:nitrate/TMAO reductase-like tetraheme cytochrome c subunit